MAVIRCQACGKPNPDFLEICQYCDAPLRGGAPAATPSPEASAERGTIRCQACGKPNPDFLEVCQYCEARLKPLAAGAPDDDLPPATSGGDALSRLRASSAPIEEEEEISEPAESAPGDWMSGLRGDAASAAPGLEPSQNEPEWMWGGSTESADATLAQKPPADETPDWLRSLGSETEAQPETPAPADDVPDWLRSMGSTEPAAPSFAPAPTQAEPEFMWGAPAAEPETPAASEDMPDWLRSMGSTEPEPPPAAPTAVPSEDMPDWLRSMGTAEPEPPPARPSAVPSEDMPDWLRSMGTAEPEPPPATPSAIPSEDMPDWLRSMGTAEPEPPSATPAAVPSEDTPDWLRSMGSAEPETPPAPAAAPSEDMPDWLRAMGTAEPETPAVPSAVPSEDVPDWLSQMGTEPAPEASATPAATPFDEVPDWLRSMGSAEAEPSEPGSPAFAPAPTQAEPEFLWGAPEPAQAEATPPSEEMPDWLRSLGGETTTAPAGEQTEPKVSPFAMPSGEMPDWLQSMAPEAEANEASAEPTATTEAPDWLSGLRSSAAEAETSAPPDEELAPGEMPAWLGSMAAGAATIPHTGPLPEIPESPPAQPAGSIFGGPTTPAKGNLAQAALPSWLTAMRPVDVGRAAVEPEMDNYEETVGFLAGVPGILRAEPTVALPRKSNLNVHKLEVSPAQAERASLLSSLLQSDTEARPASKQGLQIALPFERWIVFLVIALAVLVPSFVDLFPLPRTIAPETLKAYEAINSLPANKPVLVAFDYEPAQAGELNPVAQAVLTHLMYRGMPLVGVSTRLGGAALGNEMLNDLSTQLASRIGYTYTYGINYTSLGYLPGGAVGILEFASEPRLVFNADFSGDSEVWTKQPILSQVENLNDFGFVLIVAATPDAARAWIEQVHHYSASMPMIAAVSAGARPLVQPYYAAYEVYTWEQAANQASTIPPQLKGLVSGVVGAAQYEQQAGISNGAANKLWGGLGGGLLTAALLLLVGNLMYGVMGFMRRRRAK